MRVLRRIWKMGAVGACALLVAACSPTFDWRPVAFGAQGAAGVLPDTPQSQTRPVPFDDQTLELTMQSAEVDGILFALGSAPLPEGWGDDAAQRQRLAHWALEALYRNVGAEPPDPQADPEQRVSFQGRGPKGEVQVEAQVKVTAHEWLEAVVIAAPDDQARVPVDDFWLSLRWPGEARAAGSTASPK